MRLYREREIRLQKMETEETGKDKVGEQKMGCDKKWLAQLVLNLAYAPLTVHWSLENGLGFRDVEIGYLGFVATVASIYLGFPTS